MVFSTYFFLTWFLPVTLLVYFAMPGRCRNGWLAFSSYVFYGWFKPEYCVLLGIMTVFNYVCGAQITKSASERGKKFWVTASIAGSLGLLAFFKYAGMFTTWVGTLGQIAFGQEDTMLPVLSVALPIGISFYTFQALSYTIDLYRGHARPATSLISFAAYIAMFPQLIAGPIVRYGSIADDLRERTHSWGKILLGTRFFLLGLAKKVIIADTFALAVPAAFETTNPGFTESWLGVLSYTLQIYFDFSAYSDMAVGIGLVLGFSLPQNFNSPYKSSSITEFWRRWHMSLSTWLRDYLYLPLGGNRRGSGRMYVNLALVMLLGGLWHGASIVFILWGAWHGLLLCIERAWGDRHPLRRMPRPFSILVTQILVIIGWVPFCAGSLAENRFETTLSIFRGMFLTTPKLQTDLAGISGTLLWLVPVGIGVCLFLPNSWEMMRKLTPTGLLRDFAVGAVALVAVLAYKASPFLYFQF